MPRYNEAEARVAVQVSRSYSEVSRRLGMRPAGGNHSLLSKYVDDVWQIPTDHFDAGGASNRNLHKAPVPLEKVLVPGSTYCRHNLKQRLFDQGLKERRCEQCGQDENWRGRSMSLILDHVNGVPDDNRLETFRLSAQIARLHSTPTAGGKIVGSQQGGRVGTVKEVHGEIPDA